MARGEMGMRFRFIATICVMSDFDAITVNEIVLPSLARTFDPDDSVASKTSTKVQYGACPALDWLCRGRRYPNDW